MVKKIFFYITHIIFVILFVCVRTKQRNIFPQQLEIMSTQFHEVTVGHNKFYIDCKYREVKPAGAGAYGLVVSALDTSTGIIHDNK